ncbi:MAG: single-stranded DNA-binding protein [Firmicutes bacterium]|nr:single-stranded DNA-binding protein [Clostridiales bacterium]MBQ4339731.1 single-stranded DNA-binding protein [Bacillota bacterium]
MSGIEDVYNKITLKGTIVSEVRFSHKVYGEDFVEFDMSIMRTSGYKDIIPVTVSGRLLGTNKLSTGDYICVEGQIRTYNRFTEGKNRLLITVFVRELEIIEETEFEFDENYVFIEGYICREPFYRISPKGREITDLMIAVNRMYGKSDYIPCIAWSRNAKYARLLDVGTKIRVSGRIQSREYRKKVDEDRFLTGIAREVSIHKIEEI